MEVGCEWLDATPEEDAFNYAFDFRRNRNQPMPAAVQPSNQEAGSGTAVPRNWT